jgi:DNA-binding transcriptional MerR regulator
VQIEKETISMFKIGAFAKLSGVTVKTLRHYDELGLLKPARVDEESGYRFYTAEQLLTIRRIAGFKEQGLTLEMMRPLLTGPASLTLAERTLLEKREELER